MSKLATVAKRLVVGRPFRSDSLSHTLLPKAIALPVFASDALSSVAYAPENIFQTLSVAGLSAYAYSLWVGLAVAIVMLVVVASYRQNVHAYPSGGGDYEVATTNLGGRFGLTVASALLVDYVLTVAVSTSSGIANIGSAVPFISDHKLLFCLLVVLILAAMNLRGIRESGAKFAIPTYGFMIGVFGMVIWGLARAAGGATLRAPSASFGLHAESVGLTGFAFVFLILRTF
ncbi:MAG: APC family permease, partial [Sciscionella sp.]|nr:APC family permease [Sciscionella sp.]